MTFYISRFKNIDSVEFDVEVVTPMFLGGANATDAELRVPSFKGMLRFWWRATCGIESLEEMKKEEANFFGSTEQKASFSLQFQGLNNFKAIKSNLSPGKKFHLLHHPQRTAQRFHLDHLPGREREPLAGNGGRRAHSL